MNNEGKFLNLSFDLEKFDALLEYGVDISREDQYRISRQGLSRLADFLRENNLKATFFTTVDMANTYPQLLQGLAFEDHEIALHAITEQLDKDISQNLKDQKLAVEQIIKKEIFGCRTHKLVSLPEEDLRAAGFIYDNSLHPTYVPGRYFNILKPKLIYAKSSLIKVPVSVIPLLSLPFSWFWFRNFGSSYAIFCSRLVYFNRSYINIYLHSWDFANINIPLRWHLRPLTRNSGDKMLEMLDKYIKWCKRKGVKIMPMLNYLKLRMKDLNNDV
jgi:hypothetical protein